MKRGWISLVVHRGLLSGLFLAGCCALSSADAQADSLFSAISSSRTSQSSVPAERQDWLVSSQRVLLEQSVLSHGVFEVKLGEATYWGQRSDRSLRSSHSHSEGHKRVSYGPLLGTNSGAEEGSFILSEVTTGAGTHAVYGVFFLNSGSRFLLTRAAGRNYELQEVDIHELSPCETSEHTHRGIRGSHRMEPPVQAQSKTTVDLMVVYSPQALEEAGDTASIQAQIEAAVELSNLSYENSNVNIELRLVKTMLLEQREYGDMVKDLEALQEKKDGRFDEIHRMRNTVGADLVSMFVSEGGCGRALSGATYTHERRGFSVVSLLCASLNFSLPHEIGHNFGAHHDVNNSSGVSGRNPDSYGWGWTGEDGNPYLSIMAYGSGERVPYFSNPNVSYLGGATGKSGRANNARALNQARSEVADYRKSKSSEEPTSEYSIEVTVDRSESEVTISIFVTEEGSVVEGASVKATLSGKKRKKKKKKRKARKKTVFSGSTDSEGSVSFTHPLSKKKLAFIITADGTQKKVVVDPVSD